MDNTQAQAFPAHRLVAEFEDGQRLTFEGFTYEQAREEMEAAQIEHGDITWFDGVTDEHYENGVFHTAFLPSAPPFPPADTSDVPGFEQQTLF